MKTDRQNRPNLLQRFGNLLTGPASAARPDAATLPSAKKMVEVEVSTMPNSFDDYTDEGDEPADMALGDLVPIELAAFNLPKQQTVSAIAKSAPINPKTNGPKTDSPKTDAAEPVVTADVSTLANDLVPTELTQLNLQPKSKKSSQNPLPNLASLTRSPANITQNRTGNRIHINTDTMRVPTLHLIELNSIIQDLLDHQARQSRHNEKLGALVKQLLGQLAQQPGCKKDSQDIQQVIQNCLAGTVD